MVYCAFCGGSTAPDKVLSGVNMGVDLVTFMVHPVRWLFSGNADGVFGELFTCSSCHKCSAECSECHRIFKVHRVPLPHGKIDCSQCGARLAYNPWLTLLRSEGM